MNSLEQDPSNEFAWTNMGEIRIMQEKAPKEMVDSDMGGEETARVNNIDGVAGNRDSSGNDWKIPAMPDL